MVSPAVTVRPKFIDVGDEQGTRKKRRCGPPARWDWRTSVYAKSVLMRVPECAEDGDRDLPGVVFRVGGEVGDRVDDHPAVHELQRFSMDHPIGGRGQGA